MQNVLSPEREYQRHSVVVVRSDGGWTLHLSEGASDRSSA
jgi:hypothetical protein